MGTIDEMMREFLDPPDLSVGRFREG